MSKSKVVVYQDEKYQVVFDESQGFYHLDPIPTAQDLVEYYRREFYASTYNKQINDSSQKVQETELDFINIQYADILETIQQESPGRRILDVGCGYGNFLKFCKANDFEVEGLDPSPDAVEVVVEAGIKAVRAEIEDMGKIVEKKFNTAVLLNVLEHLRDPYKVLVDIKDFVLEDRGLLVVRVPNEFNKLQVIANEEYALKQWWVAAPQHINYFTVEHLEKLLVKAGYEVLFKESTFPLEMFILFGEQYVGNAEMGRKVHEKRVMFEKIMKKHDNNYKRKMFRMFAENGMGRDVTFYAIKK